MINVLPLTIESLVAVLLLFTILYCIRLNTQLTRLRSDETTMRKIIADLVAATATAERAIAGLKTTVREADQTLSGQLKLAERYCGEIQTNLESGKAVLDRLTQIAHARPWLVGISPAREEKPATNDPKTIIAAAQALTERTRARMKASAA